MKNKCVSEDLNPLDLEEMQLITTTCTNDISHIKPYLVIYKVKDIRGGAN